MTYGLPDRGNHAWTLDEEASRPILRKAIMTDIGASLTRLGTDYIELYQIHRFDPDTPMEETLEALHDVVKSRKARYIGASSMYASQFRDDASHRRGE